MSGFFNTILIQPFYNILITLVNIIPWADLGIAVIVLTVLVRTIIFPISKNAISSQMKMEEIKEPLKEIQKKYKTDRQKMSIEMMKLYKEHNIKPFSGFLLLLIQLPVIICLFFVISRTNLPEINPDFLYSFVKMPQYINNHLLGIFEIGSKSHILAALAAITQFIQAQIMFKKRKKITEKNMAGDMMKSMQIQMKYVMPIMMYVMSISFGSLITIYFVTGNIFSIFQEFYIRRGFGDKDGDQKGYPQKVLLS